MREKYLDALERSWELNHHVPRVYPSQVIGDAAELLDAFPPCLEVDFLQIRMSHEVHLNRKLHKYSDHLMSKFMGDLTSKQHECATTQHTWAPDSNAAMVRSVRDCTLHCTPSLSNVVGCRVIPLSSSAWRSSGCAVEDEQRKREGRLSGLTRTSHKSAIVPIATSRPCLGRAVVAKWAAEPRLHAERAELVLSQLSADHDLGQQDGVKTIGI